MFVCLFVLFRMLLILENRRPSQGGRGCTPPAHLPRSAPAFFSDILKKFSNDLTFLLSIYCLSVGIKMILFSKPLPRLPTFLCQSARATKMNQGNRQFSTTRARLRQSPFRLKHALSVSTSQKYFSPTIADCLRCQSLMLSLAIMPKVQTKDTLASVKRYRKPIPYSKTFWS